MVAPETNSSLQNDAIEEEDEEELEAPPNNNGEVVVPSNNNGEVPNDVVVPLKKPEVASGNGGVERSVDEGGEADADRSQQKPPFSYAQLIVQALLAAKDRRQTLSSIYSFIADMYPYYKLEEKGWKVRACMCVHVWCVHVFVSMVVPLTSKVVTRILVGRVTTRLV